MHGSYTRHIMEASRREAEIARAEGYQAAKEGRPPDVSNTYQHVHSWLAGYHAFTEEKK